MIRWTVKRFWFGRVAGPFGETVHQSHPWVPLDKSEGVVKRYLSPGGA